MYIERSRFAFIFIQFQLITHSTTEMAEGHRSLSSRYSVTRVVLTRTVSTTAQSTGRPATMCAYLPKNSRFSSQKTNILKFRSPLEFVFISQYKIIFEFEECRKGCECEIRRRYSTVVRGTL